MSSRRTTFHEVMEGTFLSTGGRPRRIRLDLDVRLPGVLGPRSDLLGPIAGRVRITGLADDPQAAGTLRVAPLAARRIHYRIAFTGADGQLLRLEGWKSIDPRRPVRSMTRLPAAVTDAEHGALVGEARLRFDLGRDLLRFLLGFRFPAGVPGPAPNLEHGMAAAFRNAGPILPPAASTRTATAAAPVQAPPAPAQPAAPRPRRGGARPPAVPPGVVGALLGIADREELDRTTALAGTVVQALPAYARTGVRLGSRALQAAMALRTRRSPGALDPARRDEAVRAVASGPGGALLVDALKVPLLLAAGTLRTSGSGAAPPGGAAPTASPARPTAPAAPRKTPPVRPDGELDCTGSAHWPDRTTADAVVIGSGAGGAMAARTLARAGLAVVVLEEGRRYTAADFQSRPPLERFLDLYRDGGATLALGNPPLLLPTGRGVGGTTLVNCGTSFRTPARVLRGWAASGVDIERFGELLDEVELTLQVARQPVDVLGRNGLLVLKGAGELGWQAAPLPRNAPGCGGCCQCVAGCPTNAKNGVHLNALPQACQAGARIVTRAWAERILHDRGRAAGVRVRRPDGSPFEILAPITVVACGALHSPALLRRSGLGGHPGTGRGLAVHPALSLAGRFAEPVVSWQGVLQSVGVEELHDQGILLEATASPPGMSSFVLPGAGRALRAELEGADRLAVLGAMIADRPSGRVYGRRGPLVRYGLAREDAVKLRRAMVAAGRLLFAAGAEEVLTGLPRHPVARSVADLAAIAASVPLGELHLAAFHPTGSLRMGTRAERAPVALDGRLRGVDGVFVADASVLPTCPEVNPQLSIMAMALSVAEHAARATAPAGARPATL